MSESFDVVCVGSGITALAYAASLLETRPGTRIVVLEKHRIPGGYATQFARPKHHARFDVSLHKLTGMGPDGNLREMLKRLRVLDELEPVFPDTLFRACAGDTRITLTKDPHAVLEALQQRFPDCAAGLQTVFDEISTYGYDGYMQFRTLSGEYEPDLKRLRYAHTVLKTRSTRDAIHERIAAPTLREILALPCIYVGAFPEQTSYLYFLHVWYAALFGGSAYLRGGSSALTAALVRRIERGGGRVVTRAEVQQITIDRTSMRATGVVTDIGHFHADEVIVNTSPLYALEHLVDRTLPGFDTPITAHTATHAASSTTTLYAVLDAPPARYGLVDAETMLLARDPETACEARTCARRAPAEAALSEQAYWHDSSVEVTTYHALDPTAGHVIVVNELDTIHHWPERKTDAYRGKKARARDALLGRLLEHFPDMQGHVRYVELSTPRTCLRYTNNTHGSGYGALVEPPSTKHAPSRRLPVDNLRFVSQWVSGGGYEATIGYGAMLGFQTAKDFT